MNRRAARRRAVSASLEESKLHHRGARQRRREEHGTEGRVRVDVRGEAHAAFVFVDRELIAG